MFAKRLLCVLILIGIVSSFTFVVVPAGCYPCQSTCGSLSGWHVVGEGQCSEVRYNRCLNNNCTTYAPQYDDCYVTCKWEIWADASEQNECNQIYRDTEFCGQ